MARTPPNPDRRRYQARRCQAPQCGLRFPVVEGSSLGAHCPICGHSTQFVDAPYFSDEAPQQNGDDGTVLRRLAALLDNVRSLRNVGSIFRTADGVGVEHIILGGVTPTPNHPGFAKTALGAEHTVSWRSRPDALAAAQEAAAQGWRLWALEGGVRARSLFAADRIDQESAGRVMLVLGHEVSGIDPRILELCDRVLFIPMLGHKGSLNVSVAFGIAAYTLRFSR